MNTKKFSDVRSEIGRQYTEEATSFESTPKVPTQFRLSVALIAAVLALFFIGAVAIATDVFGTQTIKRNPSPTEPGADYRESGFDFSVETKKIPLSALTGDIQEVGAQIRQQFKDYQPYDCRYPGYWEADFSSREKACEYIGFDSIKEIDWDLEEQTTAVGVRGNEMGELLTVTLETNYVVDDIRMQFFSYLYTENNHEDITIRNRMAENVTFTESVYTTDHNKQCHIISASPLLSGYMGMDGYMVDSGVVDHLHISYQEKDSTQALALMHQWANLF